MDSEQKTVPFNALVSDQSLCEAWSARQLEIIADHLGTIAQCLNTSTYKLSDQFFERIAVALEGHCGK